MDFAKLDAYLGSFYKEKNIPYCGCAVYYKHKPVYGKCFGYSDVTKKTPFTLEDLVCLYSATKVSTVTCGMILVEQGKISLSDPVSKYLPEFAHPTVLTDEGVLPAVNTMTVEHLFSMQGGLTYDRTLQLEAIRKATDGRCPTREVIRAMADAPLAFEPGTHFKYSFCHDVLGAVIEAATGKTLGENLKELVFDPIGMHNTFFHLPAEEMEKRMATRYYAFRAETETWDKADKGDINFGPEYESGGGGLLSCISDYILLAETLTNNGVAPNGSRILSKASVDNMRTNRLTGEGVEDFRIFGGWSKEGYGYGLGVRTLVDRERNNSLSANGEFGWDGALGCYIVCDPDSEVAIFYAQQESGSKWWEWHGMIRNTVYACLD